jgi:dTDP-4-amino-4,6-dideoxygalactose transaminase
MIKFLDLAKQYESIKSEIDAAVSAVIGASGFIGGRFVQQFEEDFADYHGLQYCVGVGNGTDAIEIALEALDLPRGSEVIVPANTFIATAEAVSRTGHRIVFCDCNPRNYTISVDDAAKKITRKTTAIIPVHLYGHPCDMDGVLDLADKHGLRVIEDCAQAHGAEYKGRKVGVIGDIGTFSFYPGKNLGAYGDGGAIITKDTALAKKCRMIANHGRTAKYDHEFEGRNSRLDGLQAAILSVKLRHLDKWNVQRAAIARIYQEGLSGDKRMILPCQESWAKPVWHLFVIRIDQRDCFKKYLKEMQIECGIHYPISLPKLNAFGYLGQAAEPMFANRSDQDLLSLPISDSMTFADAQIVLDAFRQFEQSRSESSIPRTDALGQAL